MTDNYTDNSFFPSTFLGARFLMKTIPLTVAIGTCAYGLWRWWHEHNIQPDIVVPSKPQLHPVPHVRTSLKLGMNYHQPVPVGEAAQAAEEKENAADYVRLRRAHHKRQIKSNNRNPPETVMWRIVADWKSDRNAFANVNPQSVRICATFVAEQFRKHSVRLRDRCSLFSRTVLACLKPTQTEWEVRQQLRDLAEPPTFTAWVTTKCLAFFLGR